jgi:nitroreductase
MNEVLKVIKSRRSVRAYKPEQLKQEELDILIEAAIYAPSGSNAQPWHFTVIQDREVINHLNNVSKDVLAKSGSEYGKRMTASPNYDITYGAPTLIIVSGKKDAPNSIADCSAAIQNILLAAESLNIGSVWLGLISAGFKVEGVAEKIGVPDEYKPFYGIALGYKQSEEKREAPTRKTEVVNYIR